MCRYIVGFDGVRGWVWCRSAEFLRENVTRVLPGERIMCVSTTWFRREEWIKVTLCVCQIHGLGEEWIKVTLCVCQIHGLGERNGSR